MPLLAMNLSDKLFLAIKELVEKGNYHSPEGFLEIAAFNQLALERGATPAEIVERGHRRIRETSGEGANGAVQQKTEPEPAPDKTTATITKRAAKPVARTVPDADTVADKDVELAFNRLAKTVRGEKSPAPCKATPHHDAKDRIFGQVNRLFPMKLACRWLATASATEEKWPKYESISDRIADDAVTIASLLGQWDNNASRKRDEHLSTGLPWRLSSSRDRFLSQFVARVTRTGEIYPGAICQYELATFQDSAIALTEQGLAFAQIDSPILDAKDNKTPTALSSDETNFLVRQVVGWVPSEYDDMKIILMAVRDGKTTPSDLTTAVQSKFPREWTQSMALTHISGLVARLAELRLLRRQWQGRHVTYELGDRVEEFLKLSRTKERPE
ncbi:MAG TPA: hypothetical protein VG013_07320 [Gemmataceae bacterium]|jgi:hypothetical protein|nr:hypothetical protein [Gemmataceae bacterium]